MAVTDLTDSLPWWTRQGAGPTGGPGAAPQGGGVGGQPPPGVSPQAWLAYLAQMFNPASGGGANPANMPSPDASPTAVFAPGDDDGHGTGDNPPVRPFALPPVAQPGPQTGPAGPVSNLPVAAAMVARPPQAPPGPMTGPAGPIANLPQPGPQTGPPPQPIYNPLSGGSANTGLPVVPAATAPVPGPLATGGAGGQGATSNPRFVQLDQGQNTDPTARSRGPQMTALNLGGLFGRGQPAVNPDVPAANAQPVSAVRGPLAAGGAGAPGRIQMDPTALAAAVSKPNWWQGLGRPDMTSGQLARAVHKPNWYRNL